MTVKQLYLRTCCNLKMNVGLSASCHEGVSETGLIDVSPTITSTLSLEEQSNLVDSDGS